MAPQLTGDICYVVGLPVATAEMGESILVENLEQIRNKVVDTLSDARIILPMKYGPMPFLCVLGGGVYAEDNSEREKESGASHEVGEAYNLV